MDYSEQLKSPMWQKKRLKIMERDNFSCQCCRSTEKQLNVHHYKYTGNNKAWEYPDNNLVTLCENCHKLIHEVQESFNVDFALITSKCISINSCCDDTGYMKEFGEAIKHTYKSIADMMFDYLNNDAIIVESISRNRTFVLLDIEFDKENSVVWIYNFYDSK